MVAAPAADVTAAAVSRKAVGAAWDLGGLGIEVVVMVVVVAVMAAEIAATEGTKLTESGSLHCSTLLALPEAWSKAAERGIGISLPASLSRLVALQLCSKADSDVS